MNEVCGGHGSVTRGTRLEMGDLRPGSPLDARTLAGPRCPPHPPQRAVQGVIEDD